MRRIEVVEQPCESVLFSIDKVAFRYNQENKKQMIKYQVELDLPDYKAIDVRLLTLWLFLNGTGRIDWIYEEIWGEQ